MRRLSRRLDDLERAERRTDARDRGLSEALHTAYGEPGEQAQPITVAELLAVIDEVYRETT